MSFIAQRLKAFGHTNAIVNQLRKNPVVSHLSKDTIEKTAKAFANQRLTRVQIRDKVTGVINATSFTSRGDASNAWSDLVDAIEDVRKK